GSATPPPAPFSGPRRPPSRRRGADELACPPATLLSRSRLPVVHRSAATFDLPPVRRSASLPEAGQEDQSPLGVGEVGDPPRTRAQLPKAALELARVGSAEGNSERFEQIDVMSHGSVLPWCLALQAVEPISERLATARILEELDGPPTVHIKK